jgi:glycosyltransferase involved in cell wall biosynthesis
MAPVGSPALSVRGPRAITHVITGLSLGGAEMMLYKMLNGAPPGVWSSRVVSLLNHGALGASLAAAGIPVEALSLGRAPWRALTRLRGVLAHGAPMLLQGWMYHGNLAALVGRPRSRPPVLWNIRQSFSGYRREKPATAAIIRAGAVVSSRSARIIYNSRVSARQHEAIGYDARRTVVIPNGFDLERFRPDPAARVALRRRLGLPADTLLIGHVARFHPMKNHTGMLEAAAIVAGQERHVAFVLAGTGIDKHNAELLSQIERLRLGSRIHLIGTVRDTPGLMAGLDVLCQSSGWGEGFPNVLGEAMASGVVCAATDVGDSRWLLGDAGEVLPPHDTAGLAAALLRLVRLSAMERSALGAGGRERIAAEFDLTSVIARYVGLYEEVLDSRP